MQKLIKLIAVMGIVGTSVVLGADESLWKRVQRLDPGARVKVTVEGAAALERYFVRLSETELVVLNLSAPDLPKRQLLNMTRENPEWMAGTAKTIYKESSVRVGPDGVFVKDKKVADLASVVEHLPRARVTDVRKS